MSRELPLVCAYSGDVGGDPFDNVLLLRRGSFDMWNRFARALSQFKLVQWMADGAVGGQGILQHQLSFEISRLMLFSLLRTAQFKFDH